MSPALPRPASQDSSTSTQGAIPAAMPIYEMQLEALEPLLFGDNRSARAGVDHLQQDQDPSPLTLHGALGWHLVSRSSTWPEAVLGQRRKDILNPDGEVAQLLGHACRLSGGDLLFPKPRHLLCVRARGELFGEELLCPKEYPGDRSGLGHSEQGQGEPGHEEQDQDERGPELAAWGWAQSQPGSETSGGQRGLSQGCIARSGAVQRVFLQPREHRPKEEAEGDLWVDRRTLAQVLRGELPEDGGLYEAEQIYRPEDRPGVAVDPDTGTVIEGLFFNRPYRRFKPAAAEVVSGNPSQIGAGYVAWLQTLGEIDAQQTRTGEPGAAQHAEKPAAELDGRLAILGGDQRRARVTVGDSCSGRHEVLGDVLQEVLEAAQKGSRGAANGLCLVLLTPALVLPDVEETGAEGPCDAGACNLLSEKSEAAQALADCEPVAMAGGKARQISGWDVARRCPRPIRHLLPAGSVLFYRWPPGSSAEERRALVRRLWLTSLGDQGAAAGFGRCLVGLW